MTTAIQAQARTLTRQERAERAQQHRDLMAPHINAAAGALGMSMNPLFLMMDGKMAERVLTPEQLALLDKLNELSEIYARHLGLATPSQAG